MCMLQRHVIMVVQLSSPPTSTIWYNNITVVGSVESNRPTTTCRRMPCRHYPSHTFLPSEIVVGKKDASLAQLCRQTIIKCKEWNCLILGFDTCRRRRSDALLFFVVVVVVVVVTANTSHIVVEQEMDCRRHLGSARRKKNVSLDHIQLSPNQNVCKE